MLSHDLECKVRRRENIDPKDVLACTIGAAKQMSPVQCVRGRSGCQLVLRLGNTESHLGQNMLGFVLLLLRDRGLEAGACVRWYGGNESAAERGHTCMIHSSVLRKDGMNV